MKNDRNYFNALLLLLIWIPIPLGSNRAWAWSIIEIYSFLLLISWISFQSSDYNYQKIRHYLPLFIIFSIVQIWVFIQQISIPIGWLEIIAPVAAEHFLSAGSNSGSLSFDPAHTFILFMRGCSYLSILFLTIVLTNTEKRLRTLAYIMILSGIYQALYGALMVLTDTHYLFFHNDQHSGVTKGTFMYRNHYANFLMLTLSLGIGMLVGSLASSRKSKLKHKVLSLINTIFSSKALLRLGLMLMVIALVMSRSRMGNTSFFVSMTICCLFALLFMKGKTRGLIWLFGSLLVIDIFIVSSWFGLEKVQQRLEATSIEQETRDEVVLYSLELIKQNPYYGSGAGSYYSSFQSVQGEGIKDFYDFAHNEYIQFAVEFGIPATLLLGIAVIWSLWHAQIALRKRNKSLMKGIGFAAMMAIIGNLIHMSVDFTLQPPANAIYFIVILAMSWMSRYMRVRK